MVGELCLTCFSKHKQGISERLGECRGLKESEWLVLFCCLDTFAPLNSHFYILNNATDAQQHNFLNIPNAIPYKDRPCVTYVTMNSASSIYFLSGFRKMYFHFRFLNNIDLSRPLPLVSKVGRGSRCVVDLLQSDDAAVSINTMTRCRN